MFFQIKNVDQITINLDMPLSKDQVEEEVFLTLILQMLFLIFLVQIFLMTSLKVLEEEAGEGEEIQIIGAQI